MEKNEITKTLEQYTVRELQVLAEIARVRGRSRLKKRELILELTKRGYRPHDEAEGPATHKRIKERLVQVVDGLSAGGTLNAGRLEIIPLEANDITDGATPLFEEVDTGTVVIEEVEGGGSVPELRLIKTSAGRTLLVEGEPLVGGNQDRVLSTSIAIDGPTDVVVPVTCIEERRWATSSRRFSSSPYHSYYTSRSVLSRGTSSSLRTSSLYRSDQSAVWREIAFSLESSGTRSGTRRMSDIFEEHKETVERYQRQLTPLPRQLGYQANIDGAPKAFELFGSHDTFVKYWPKLLNGLAMEALISPDIRKRRSAPSHFDKKWIIRAIEDSVCEMYKSIAAGLDVRITGRRHMGSALIYEQQIEHFVLHFG